MGSDIFEVAINLAKVAVIFLMMVQAVPLLVWLERRGSAFIQNRLGPNRVGPLGLLQLLADAVKFIFKEQFLPADAAKFLFFAAPVVALIPAALGFTAIPLSLPIHVEEFQMLGSTWGPYNFYFQGARIEMGILYVLAVSSLGAYGLLLAGWSSSNKFSLLGALRASAQMISYELALGTSLVGMLLVYGTFDLNTMVEMQQGPLAFSFLGSSYEIGFLPNWGIFYQPLGILLFLVCIFAESNRLPFDMPEAEAELVAGFHTEYGGFKMLLFFIGEYGHMMVGSGLLITLYLGGYLIPGVSEEWVRELISSEVGEGTLANILVALVFHLSFLIKIALMMWFFIWVRWTLPRFRYDKLMNLGWKTLLPWALGNAIVTAIVLFFARGF